MSRGGRRERIAVRLNAILRKLPKNASLDGKQWHAETSARRSLMRYIVGIVGRLIEEEDERANDRRLADERLPEEGTTIDLCGTPVHVKPGETLEIRASDSSPVRTLPVERILTWEEEQALGIRRKCATCGDPVPLGYRTWCDKSACIPF